MREYADKARRTASFGIMQVFIHLCWKIKNGKKPCPFLPQETQIPAKNTQVETTHCSVASLTSIAAGGNRNHYMINSSLVLHYT